MLNLLPITKIVSIISGVFAVLVAIIFGIMGSDIDTGTKIFSTMRYAAVLEVLIFLVVIYGWRLIWKFIPILNEWLFPDINGEWEVEIDWIWDENSGNKKGTAYIKQNLLKMNMELITDQSESETLIVHPVKDSGSGRPIVYYVYRNLPKELGGQSSDSHEGAAILKLDPKNTAVLEGNYFTNRNTRGRFKLSRTQ